MNGITKIALSLSLITLIAQPTPDMSLKQMPHIQAAPLKKYAQKTAKIAGYTLVTLFGVAFLSATRRDFRLAKETQTDEEHPRVTSNIGKAACAFTGFALMYYGIKGIKNELSKKKEHTA